MPSIPVYRILLACYLALSLSGNAWAQQNLPSSPFEGPLIPEQELIEKKEWDKKTSAELRLEYENIKKDISLMEKRLGQLSGITRLNQDQYREKDILNELTYIKQRELTILGKLLDKDSGMAPDFTLPGTEGKEIALQDFRDNKNVLLIFYLFDFSPT
jgi:hypothetical protein